VTAGVAGPSRLIERGGVGGAVTLFAHPIAAAPG
jgi:hypothetical protein